VRFGAAFWLQRTDWPPLRDAALAAERAGFDSLWFDDHLLADEGDWHDPKLEGWAALAALAPLTSRARLGLLVAANTFRNPGLTAKLSVTLDHLSGGRFTLGIGGGWFRREHEAFGLDFGSGFGERLDRLEEAVALIERLLGGETVTHEGRFYRLVDAVCEPRPIQDRLPILIGGSGREKTLRTVARHADMWNAYAAPERVRESLAILGERCAEIGRPFDSIAKTVYMEVVIRPSEAGVREYWSSVEDRHGIRGRVGSDGTPRLLNVGRSPDAVAEYVRQFEMLGIGEVIWIFRNPFDLETMSRLADVRELLRSPVAT
jgi:alkanesulfonate monooxygenase SsuD/methylene tetrahydromethanopterin reductase-like flavin-dependent oxidoreductase (luciferase family)